jgi:hypothetical protein
MLQLLLRQLGSQFCILGAQAINLGLQFFILGTQPSYYFTHSASSPGRDKMQKFLVVFNAAAHRLGEIRRCQAREPVAVRLSQRQRAP